MTGISVIIPNYNNEKYIRKCIDSVLSQKCDKVEVIVVDDGSTDSSAKIVKEISKANKNLKLIEQKNQGASSARNNGIKAAKYEYILFLDSDDFIHNDVLKNILEDLEKNNPDILIGNYTIENKEVEEKFTDKTITDKKYIYSHLLPIRPVPANKFYKKSIIEKNNLEWKTLGVGQDLNFYLKFMSFVNKVSTTSTTIFNYNIIEGSISRTYTKKILDIKNSLDDIKGYYTEEAYEKYLQGLIIIHYHVQMRKYKYFKSYKERLSILKTFSKYLKEVDTSKIEEWDKYKKEYFKMRIKIAFKVLLAI